MKEAQSAAAGAAASDGQLFEAPAASPAPIEQPDADTATSSTTTNDNEPMPSSQAPTSAEDVGHEGDAAQDEEHDPNAEPEETPLLQIPAPSIEPANDTEPITSAAKAVPHATAANDNNPLSDLLTGTD